MKNKFGRLFSVDSMLNIDTDVIRDTKNFEINETRLLLTDKNKNVNNKFEVNVIEKKNNDLLFLIIVI